MNNTQQNTPNPSAPEVEKEGEKVTGGETTPDKAENENAATGTQGNEEYTPATETSKEEMTGYNELPEQEKVGGA